MINNVMKLLMDSPSYNEDTSTLPDLSFNTSLLDLRTPKLYELVSYPYFVLAFSCIICFYIIIHKIIPIVESHSGSICLFKR